MVSRSSESLIVLVKLGNLFVKDPMEGRGGQTLETMEGKMARPSRSTDISTRLNRVAQVSRERPDMAWTTLAHHIDVEFLRESFTLIRKSGAVGVDGVTAEEYSADLNSNIQSLYQRFQDGSYRAPPVRRVYIPKGRGKVRPIGIPTLEDKILQHAVARLLGAVYEQDFLSCSYGFRPKRSAHDALEDLQRASMATWGGWVIDMDIESFFDSLDHAVLRSFLEQRIRDGVIRRVIGKWLQAGVLEDGIVHRSRRGSPQGGVISPLLANIYLHHVLDTWFQNDVQPRMEAESKLIRYADDCVMLFAIKADAEKVFAVLPKRLARFGLGLHPEKTKLVVFKRPPRHGPKGGGGPGSFDFLGFTHYWGQSRKGNMVVRRKTSKENFRRSVRAIFDWCKRYRHLSVVEQHQMLRQKLLGHYRYFGVTGNYYDLDRFLQVVRRSWRTWLNRRSSGNRMPWDRFVSLLARYPLPRPRVYQSIRVASP